MWWVLRPCTPACTSPMAVYMSSGQEEQQWPWALPVQPKAPLRQVISEAPGFAFGAKAACGGQVNFGGRLHFLLATSVLATEAAHAGSSSTQQAVLPTQFEGSRSAEEIQKFWQSSEHPSINKQEWSMEEVERLTAVATAHGHLQWQLVAKELGVRTGLGQTLGHSWALHLRPQPPQPAAFPAVSRQQGSAAPLPL